MASFHCIYPSPLGDLLIKADEGYINCLHFLEEDEKIPPGISSSLVEECKKQLDAYFSGKLMAFNLPISQPGTAFQQNVWATLLEIGYGKTSTYLQVSKRLGNTLAIRAVGAANGKNNIAIIVPCHRVIGADGSLVGYAGGIWRKRWLLDHEARYGGGVQVLF